MPGLLWKIPLVVMLALLAAAANLATHVRARAAEQSPVQLAPTLRAPPDGLARAKRAAAQAAEVATLRAAVRAFHDVEGRAPLSLHELDASGYLRAAAVSGDLRRFRYDPESLTVSYAAR